MTTKVIIVVAAIVIVLLLLGLLILLYVLNGKTPVPDDCPKDELDEGCGACMLSCHNREKKFDVKNLIKKDEESKDDSTDNKEK